MKKFITIIFFLAIYISTIGQKIIVDPFAESQANSSFRIDKIGINTNSLSFTLNYKANYEGNLLISLPNTEDAFILTDTSANQISKLISVSEVKKNNLLIKPSNTEKYDIEYKEGDIITYKLNFPITKNKVVDLIEGEANYDSIGGNYYNFYTIHLDKPFSAYLAEKNPVALYQAGKLKWLSGQKAKAFDYYEQSAKIGNGNAQYQLGYVYLFGYKINYDIELLKKQLDSIGAEATEELLSEISKNEKSIENTNSKMIWFKDPRDGKDYRTIKIGTQTWFADNLAYKVSKGCWAYDNDEYYISRYGYLYEWKTAKTVCPPGWHLPSDTEWTRLTSYLGDFAGRKMKATTDWQYDVNGVATNESGFYALPAGIRNVDGSFSDIGMEANFWSSTPRDTEGAEYRLFTYYTGQEEQNYSEFPYGLSIRCIKD